MGSIRALIDRSAKEEAVKTDLNWQDKQGKTPIFYAAEYGHAKLVQLYLDRGADPMVENNNGWTVLHAAVNGDKLECVSGVLEHARVKECKAALLGFTDKSKPKSTFCKTGPVIPRSNFCADFKNSVFLLEI